MKDIRFKQLAQNLVKNSIKVNIGDNVLIEVFDLQPEMIVALVEAVTEAEGNPFVKINSSKVIRAQFMYGSEEFWRIQTDLELRQMKKMQCYIAIRAYDNAYEYSDIPSDKMRIVDKIYSPVTEYRCKNTKWCVLRFPTVSLLSKLKKKRISLGIAMPIAPSLTAYSCNSFKRFIINSSPSNTGDSIESIVSILLPPSSFPQASPTYPMSSLAL